MKIKFNSDDDLALKKTPDLHDIIIVVPSAFNDNNKYYPRVFSDACMYKSAE